LKNKNIKTYQSTTNPEDVWNGGGLFPLGGSELSSGYKGYGLTFMVEILCGILGNAKYGPNIRTWHTGVGESNIGQCFIAINPGNFAPGFEGRLQDLMNHCRNSEPVSPFFYFQIKKINLRVNYILQNE
jgi:LDH2 family malate/lactate/ureidoglycolate dehydrogenase